MVDEYLDRLPWDGPSRVDIVALELARDGSIERLAHYRDAVGGAP
jgi:hypothetical protein